MYNGRVNTSRGMGLRLKIFLGMAAAALVPLVTVAVSGYSCARDAFVRLQRDHVLTELRAARDRLVAFDQVRRAEGAGGIATAAPATLAAIAEPDGCRLFRERVLLLSPDGRVAHASPGTGAVAGAPVRLPDEAWLVPTAEVAVDRFRFAPAPFARWRDARGDPMLSAATAVPGTGFLLVVATPEGEPHALLGGYRTHALATALFAFLFAILLALSVAGRIARPFRLLARAAQRVAEGRHDLRVGGLPGREAGELAEAFDRMLDEIEKAHARIVGSATLAAIGELSSSVVHEMRNPLTSVKINLQALRKRMAAAGDPLHEELAGIALDQAQRLERMLSDLLQYGKPLALGLERIRFRDLADAAVDLVRPSFAERGILYRVEDRLLDRRLMGDRELLLRALVNLLSNAGHASPDGAAVTLTGRAEGATLLLEVEDRGPGVREADRASLFRPFFTTRAAGTGLGLANVKKIVERHGGTVAHEPAAAGGARFVVRLREDGPPPDPVEPGDPATRLGGTA